MPPSIAARRIAATRLSGAPFPTVIEAVAAHGAVQAQDHGPTKWSLWLRTMGKASDEVDRALETGELVRTHVLRTTWHLVARDDLRDLLALTAPRVRAQMAPRLGRLGLDARTLTRCEGVIGDALRGGRLTRDQIAARLDAEGIDRAGQRLPHILMHCELRALICSGGYEGRHHTYARLDERVPARSFDRESALVELVRRYLRGHGPAAVKDLAWWSSLKISDIRAALGALGDEVVSEEAEGLTLWSLRGAPNAPEVPRVLLLPAYDELIVGYTESRYVGDPRARDARSAYQDRQMPTGLLLVDGRIAGHWRRTVGARTAAVEVRTYEALRGARRAALEAEVGRLGDFLGREPVLEVGVL